MICEYYGCESVVDHENIVIVLFLTCANLQLNEDP